MISNTKQKRLPCRSLFCCGAGGSRTLVQTGKPYAFYMLIPVFIFVIRQDLDHQPYPYPLNLHPPAEASKRLFPMFPAPLYLPDSEQHPEERCLVPSPSERIKPVIYCTSIRQRERSCFRQLIFRPNGLWSIQPSLRMLTYHLSPLSNPVNPKKCTFALQR